MIGLLFSDYNNSESDVAQYFKLTYKRKQIVTDYIGDQVMRETTNEITEVIGGLPAMTVANYRKVLGDQVVSVEPETPSDVTPRLGSGKDNVRATRRQQVRKEIRGAAAEVDGPMESSYAGLVNKMAARERENAA